MLALRRADVADLNHLGRALMDTDGRLGKDRLAIANHEFAAGDRIVCLRNSDVLGVKNGTLGTVRQVDLERRTLTIDTDRGPSVELSGRYLEAGNARHAYAITGHAAQGLTVQRAFVLGSGEARLQEWGYVALSRARTETRLYVTGTPREHESHFHDLDDRDPLARFGRALEESAVEELAVDQKPLSSGPRHDARPEIERSRLSPDGLLQRRLLEQKKLALIKTRDGAQRRVEDAERRLEQSGPFRRRGRAELRAELELQRHAVTLAKQQLVETIESIDRLPTTTRAGLQRDGARDDRTVSRERQTIPLRIER
jgi:hypothetical protein